MMTPVLLMMSLALPLVLCQNRDWHVGADHTRGGGVMVHGHANTPSVNGFSGTVHGSRVFGGPSNGAQAIGGGANYHHPNGLYGNADATHHRGQGTAYSGTVGGSTRVGPGTLSVGGGAHTLPGSSRVQGHVGATYNVPLGK